MPEVSTASSVPHTHCHAHTKRRGPLSYVTHRILPCVTSQRWPCGMGDSVDPPRKQNQDPAGCVTSLTPLPAGSTGHALNLFTLCWFSSCCGDAIISFCSEGSRIYHFSSLWGHRSHIYGRNRKSYHQRSWTSRSMYFVFSPIRMGQVKLCSYPDYVNST